MRKIGTRTSNLSRSMTLCVYRRFCCDTRYYRLHISEQPPQGWEKRQGAHAGTSTKKIGASGVAVPAAGTRSLRSPDPDGAQPVKKLPLFPVWEFMKGEEGWNFCNETYSVWFPGAEETKMEQHEVRCRRNETDVLNTRLEKIACFSFNSQKFFP